MSDISSAIRRLDQYLGEDVGSVASQIGISAAQRALSMSFPNDFEYYMMAFELVDYLGNTIDYFVFPVNPSTYSQDEPSATSVRKTMGGVSVVGNSSFIPIDIRISGNFGRKFKLLVGDDNTKSVAVAQYSTTDGAYNKESFIKNVSGKFRKLTFDTRVKSGYGACKILQAMCDKSRGDISGKPNQLYMYNPAFGANFLVKVINASFSQAVQSSNFIWGYELTLKAIAPLEVIVGASNVNKSLSSSMRDNIIQNTASKVMIAALNVISR